MEKKTFVLEEPIKFGNDTIEEVELRLRVKAGDMLVMDTAGGNVEADMLLISKLSGLSVAEIKEMGYGDFQTLQKEVAEVLRGKKSE